MSVAFDRRSIIAFALVAVAPLPAFAAEPEVVEFPVNDRLVSLSVWRPATIKGVVLFSHDAGGSPEAYAPLFGAWRDAGYLVVAPLHTDSPKNARVTDHSLQTAFLTRIEDMGVAGAWASISAVDKPVAVAGHGYGSLSAMVRAGALEERVHARDQNAKALIAFSTPGGLADLVADGAVATLNLPMLLLTGDADLVPGAVTDWRDHLSPYEGGPAAGRMAWIGKGVDHGLAARALTDPMAAKAAALSVTFLDANLLGDAAAKTRLAATDSTADAEIRRR